MLPYPSNPHGQPRTVTTNQRTGQPAYGQSGVAHPTALPGPQPGAPGTGAIAVNGRTRAVVPLLTGQAPPVGFQVIASNIPPDQMPNALRMVGAQLNLILAGHQWGGVPGIITAYQQ